MCATDSIVGQCSSALSVQSLRTHTAHHRRRTAHRSDAASLADELTTLSRRHSLTGPESDGSFGPEPCWFVVGDRNAEMRRPRFTCRVEHFVCSAVPPDSEDVPPRVGGRAFESMLNLVFLSFYSKNDISDSVSTSVATHAKPVDESVEYSIEIRRVSTRQRTVVRRLFLRTPRRNSSANCVVPARNAVFERLLRLGGAATPVASSADTTRGSATRDPIRSTPLPDCRSALDHPCCATTRLRSTPKISNRYFVFSMNR